MKNLFTKRIGFTAASLRPDMQHPVEHRNALVCYVFQHLADGGEVGVLESLCSTEIITIIMIKRSHLKSRVPSK